ncbi:MAG: hypothetical protein ACTHNO_00170 [Ralstonia sp.]|uniref:hypothetical protein n=1 Tax=Ralstonia sp. TaxID=54061 RepID=UPI003F8153D0
MNDPNLRPYVALTGRLPDLLKTNVAVGFALDPSSTAFPSEIEFSEFLKLGIDPADVWRTIVLAHALRDVGRTNLKGISWPEAVNWFAANRQEAMQLLSECDLEIADQGRYLLIVFDALDRIGKNWDEVRSYLKSLLELTLQSRSRRAIRLKVFLRPDMEEDEEVWNFVDSSKLRANRMELTWRPMDLFALVVMYLANDATVGRQFREEVERATEARWSEEGGIYQLPRGFATGEQPVRSIVESITGEWVGTSAKRGYVYTWVPTHLADARSRLSPRSFLLAFRAAAEWTEDHESEHDRALHYKGIQQGVAKASEIRVSEISEDYPWVKPLLEAARGLTVPCFPRELMAYWKPRMMDQFKKAMTEKLPPRRFGTDPLRRDTPDALIEDLVELAILYRTEDARLNIPDIFRVGFGIRRMGGVRPPR